MISLYEITLVLLRGVTGFIVVQHGAQNLLGNFGGPQAFGVIPPVVAGGVELVCGFALAAGVLTRISALIVALDMAILYVTYFLPDGFPPIVNRQGEVACLLFAVNMLLAFTGPGVASVDRFVASRTRWREPLAGLTEHASAAFGAIRILIGVLFLSYGLQKMFGMFGEPPEPFLTLQWFAGIIELFGGMALIVGFQTRAVAFLCSGEMAFAYFINHSPEGLFPVDNGGERAVLFCFYFLFLFAAGAGKWSVDGLLGGRTNRGFLPQSATRSTV